MAITIGLAEAKNNFSRVTAAVNRTGRAVTVLKNNRPWVVINPAMTASKNDMKLVNGQSFLQLFKCYGF